MKTKTYNSVDDFSLEEIMGIFNSALNAEGIEEKQAREDKRRRAAKADFCNLNAETINECVFIEK